MHEIQKKYEREITEIVAACHRLGDLGYVASAGGNVSYRVEDNLVLLTPTQTPKRLMKEEYICAVDINGNTVFAPDGKRPTGEMPLHTHIMRQRADVKAVIHAHPPNVTAFAILDSDLLARPFYPESMTQLGPVRRVPYAEPNSQKLADAFSNAIKDANGFIMANHGALTCSKSSVFEAMEYMQVMEMGAYSVFVASMLGKPAEITRQDIKDLDKLLVARGEKCPGELGRYQSMLELFPKE